MPSVVGPEESRGHRRWVPSSPQVLSHRRRRALCPPSPLELPPMRATVGRLGSHLPRRRARELPATIFHHQVKVVAALMLSSSWRPLVGRFWLSYPTSLPDTSSNRYATPRRHHHETTSAPSPSLPANATSTTPRQAAAGRMKTSRRLRTASLLHRLPHAWSSSPMSGSQGKANEAVSPQPLLQPKLTSSLCGLTEVSPSPGAKSPVAAPVYPKVVDLLSPSTACASENPIILPSSPVHHPPCIITSSSPHTSTPQLLPAVPALPPCGRASVWLAAWFGPPCVPAQRGYGPEGAMQAGRMVLCHWAGVAGFGPLACVVFLIF
jgi:hypothetical protein